MDEEVRRPAGVTWLVFGPIKDEPHELEIEFHQIELKYAALRVSDALRLGRLVASLADIGQQSPILTVESAGRHVLIDGYLRVAALKRLAKDTVQAVALAMTETEALLFRHRTHQGQAASAIEEGWLLRELHEMEGLSLKELAARFVRTTSWVSRRLSLVRDLPESIQMLVRQGQLSAHAAMKYLVPLARANWAHAEELAGGIAGAELSERQVGEIYDAWRKASPEARQKVVAHPLLLLKATEAARFEPLPTTDEQEQEREILRDIERLGSLARRVRRALSDYCRARRRPEAVDVMAAAWNHAQRCVDELRAVLERTLVDA